MIRRRGIRSFCHGDASTSTLKQLHHANKELQVGSGGADAASSSFFTVPPSVVGSCYVAESEVTSDCAGGGPSEPAVTLEQMILQLDLEEEAARKARRRMAAEEDGAWCPRRMSCVDTGGSSAAADHVLRSARDALSQYPRFSLDGRDAMYRASFSNYYDGMGLCGAAQQRRNSPVAGSRVGHRPRASYCAAAGGGSGPYEMDLERTLRMPATVAGESVVWCKPGVVAKLMGLEAVPVPVRGGGFRRRRRASGLPPPAAATTCVGGGVGKQQRLRRTGQEQEEELAFQKERLFMALHGYDVVGAEEACHSGAHRPAALGPNSGGNGKGRNAGDGRQFVGLRRR